MIRLAAIPPALMLLAGCSSGSGNYPSLALRPVEQQSFAEPVRTAAVAAPDPALDARIASQSNDLDRIAAGFSAAAEAARRSAGAVTHQPVGSEAWLTAQAALAKVDDWRSQASALTAAIESAGSARAAALQPAYPALDALAARAAAETDREAQTAEQLQRSVPGA